MTTGQGRPMDEERIRRVSRGLRPAITMQPTVGGEAGEPLGIVFAEVVCPENEENDLFAGLAEFVRAERPAEKAATDIALEKLLQELGLKGRKLGADAIVSTNFHLLRGVHTAGHKVLRMTATGTAVVLPPDKNRSVMS
jgi:uncharacterized protein YbjQ (UPF0145 family)